MNNPILSEEQASAIHKIIAWIDFDYEHDSLEFKLGGYAGTGKTTLLKELERRLRVDGYNVAIVAFTGKAVSVLKKKGLPSAQTLHSLMYDVEVLKGGGVTFHRKPALEEKVDVIIVDEASMISTELYEDLKRFHKKILFVGDPGQLEPVGDNPNLMRSPDLTLERIHRQAEESAIITLATNVRMGSPIVAGTTLQELTTRKKLGFNMSDAILCDQVICARNKTRHEINMKFRRALKKPERELVEGDKIIVLRNNSYFGVFNGLILFVKKVYKSFDLYWEVDLEDEMGTQFHKLPIWKLGFQVEDMPKDFVIPRVSGPDNPSMVYATFAYCITCHKAQGSEWDKVVVWDEYLKWDMSRWRYTAITRAAKQLIYCL